MMSTESTAPTMHKECDEMGNTMSEYDGKCDAGSLEDYGNRMQELHELHEQFTQLQAELHAKHVELSQKFPHQVPWVPELMHATGFPPWGMPQVPAVPAAMMQQQLPQTQDYGFPFPQAGLLARRPGPRQGGTTARPHRQPAHEDATPVEFNETRCDELKELLREGNEESRSQAIAGLKGKVKQASLQSYEGSMLVQHFSIELETVAKDAATELLKELDGCVKELVDSRHGNHVLQNIIKEMPARYCGFIADEVLGNVDFYARHHFGCRIVCRLIEFSSPRKLELIATVLKNADSLCRHKFAHYVVEAILEFGTREHKRQVLEVLKKDPLRLIQDHSASFVIMTALKWCEDQDTEQFAEFLLDRCGAPLVTLIGSGQPRARVGARVLLSLAGVSRVHESVLKLVRDSMETLSAGPHGRQLLDKLKVGGSGAGKAGEQM